MKRILFMAFILITLAFPAFQSLGAEEKQEQVRYTATVDADGVQRIDVVGGSYFYKPNYIVVKANVPVELKVTKESGMIPHDIAMKSPEAGMEFSEGIGSTSKVIKFTPTKTGKYPFYCTMKSLFSSHREKGMEGVIEVVP
jgi:heme/copper-type cytochrome/quinol oxidase subunit 2